MVGSDRGEYGVAPGDAGDAHDEKDDEGGCEVGRVCKGDAACGPYQVGEDGGKRGAPVQTDDGYGDGSDCQSATEGAGHEAEAEAETAAIEHFYGGFGD